MANSTTAANRAIEENIMAILDSSGVRDSRDLHDDRLSFLEAVRKTSLVSDSTAPTRRMYNAVFDIMRKDEGDLEVVMACYQILKELEQWYPRVSLSGGEVKEIIVNKEGWSPFIISLDNIQLDGVCSQKPQDLLDSHKFSLLLQEFVQALADETSSTRVKTLKEMLLFEYVVSVLESDFIPRQSVYKDTLNWVLMRESLLNMLLCSRRLIFKGFIRDCISVISKRCLVHDRILLYDKKSTEACDSLSLAFALSEIEQKARLSVQKLLIMVMELDLIKKEAEALGHTSRADGVRSPALEIILDELTYDTDLVSPFLQAFSEPKWKLEIILQYFWKYCSKPCVRTRNSDKSDDTATLGSVLNYLFHSTNMKIINRRITAEVIRLLLAHAFQAYLYLHDDPKYIASMVFLKDSSSLSEICRGTIYAFENLRKNNRCRVNTVNCCGSCEDYLVEFIASSHDVIFNILRRNNQNYQASTTLDFRDMDMSPLEKEAVFTATFLSTRRPVAHISLLSWRNGDPMGFIIIFWFM